MPLGSSPCPPGTDTRNAWDEHWRVLDAPDSRLGRIARLTRRFVLGPAVRTYAERHFDSTGVFVEVGCGTGESSALIPSGRRRLIGLDISPGILARARRLGPFRGLVCADAMALPFADGSVSGVWNLGVMEHFDRVAGHALLCELRRVLRPGGVAILFWPPAFNASRWLLGPIEWARSAGRRPPFRFFPDEVSLLRSRREARERVEAAGLAVQAIDFSARTAFIHMVIVARRTRP